MKAKKSSGRGKKPRPSPNSRKGLVRSIKKNGFEIPEFKDEKGKKRQPTTTELKHIRWSIGGFKKLGLDPKKYGAQFMRQQKEYIEYQKKAKKEKREFSAKQIHGIIPKIKKQEGYHYIQAGSAPSFVMGEIEGLKRNVIVRRQGRDTKIDTPEKILQLTKAMKQARSDYRKTLREKSKTSGMKVSDMMFFAATREGKNTIIDLDAIEYAGLTNDDIYAAGLK